MRGTTSLGGIGLSLAIVVAAAACTAAPVTSGSPAPGPTSSGSGLAGFKAEWGAWYARVESPWATVNQDSTNVAGRLIAAMDYPTGQGDISNLTADCASLFDDTQTLAEEPPAPDGDFKTEFQDWIDYNGSGASFCVDGHYPQAFAVFQEANAASAAMKQRLDALGVPTAQQPTPAAMASPTQAGSAVVQPSPSYVSPPASVNEIAGWVDGTTAPLDTVISDLDEVNADEAEGNAFNIKQSCIGLNVEVYALQGMLPSPDPTLTADLTAGLRDYTNGSDSCIKGDLTTATADFDAGQNYISAAQLRILALP